MAQWRNKKRLMAARCLNQAPDGGTMFARSARWRRDASLKRPMVPLCLEEAPDGGTMLQVCNQWLVAHCFDVMPKGWRRNALILRAMAGGAML
jgi:hypothetical protein